MSKGAKISSLDQADLAKWIKAIRKKRNEKFFLDIMNKVYDKVLSDQSGKTPKASDGALKDMFKTSSNNEYQGGYLTYPLGSYIVSYMNGKPEYLEALNLLANFGTYISQCTVDMSAKSTIIKIIKFS